MSKKINICFFVSGGGSNMQAILDAINKGEINANPSLVIASRPNIFALERAVQNNIKSAVVKKKDFADDASFGDVIMKHLMDCKIDVIVLCGYLSMIPQKVINAYSGKIINIHPSLLPAFGGHGMYGLKVHQAVLDYGAKVTGATVHYVDENYDTGKIIYQKAVNVKDNDTAEILQKRVFKSECDILVKAVKLLCN